MKMFNDKTWLSEIILLIFLLGCFDSNQKIYCDETQWFEGTMEADDGATRDYYNRAGSLNWRNYLGDWIDADNVPQGKIPFSAVELVDDDTPKWIQWNITELVKGWINKEYPNKGAFIGGVSGQAYLFYSREYSNPDLRPKLIIFSEEGIDTVSPEADTYLEPTTYQCFGNSEELRLSSSNNILIRFDLAEIVSGSVIDSTILELYCYAQYGSIDSAHIYRCGEGHEKPDNKIEYGIAENYSNDIGIDSDADVFFSCDFESPDWDTQWSSISHPDKGLIVDSEHENLFESLNGKAVRSRIPEGENFGMSLSYNFQEETGNEPEEIYFRYYLRMGDNWKPTIEGGKLPGISGTYNTAGWGGRKSDGTNGWSARGTFGKQIPSGNPLAEKDNPIGYYCYHADMESIYGNVWLWVDGYGGFLENNRWYCIEQYVKMNTSGENNGILKGWVDGRLSFEKTDIKFRTVDHLKIEKIWMNVYHGGTSRAPQDMDLYFDNVVVAKKYIGPVTNVNSVNNDKKIEFKMQSTPNPFNSTTYINYQLAESGYVELVVYDKLGNKVSVLVSEFQDFGKQQIMFDGSKFASGLYYYVISTGTDLQYGKMMLTR